MELRQYFSIVWKWLWLILLSTAIAAGISYFTTSRQPKIYQASAKLLVGQSIQNPDPNTADLFTSQTLAITYLQIAKTSTVLQGAIDALGVKMSAEDLGSRTNANSIPGTQLIQVSVVDTDPARAQALTNEIAHQLTLQGPASTQQEQSKQREFIQTQVDDLQNKIEGAQKSIRDLNAAIQGTSRASEIASNQQQLAVLQTQVSQWQQNYAALLALLAPKSPNYLSILEPASLPQYPIAPNLMQSVLLAASVGLLLAIAGAFLIEFLDDGIKRPEEVTKLLQLPSLGSIARIQGMNDQKLIVSFAPRSPHTEAYRILRTNLQFSSVDKPLKSIMVTSPGPNEGKSLTAANLAIVMAQAGLKTILVDSDLRIPTQHQLFGFTNDVGLTNAVFGQAGQNGFMRPTKIENLSLVTTGALPPNPAELLASERMRAFKSNLSGMADIVIFDSPPAVGLTDAAILSRLVDGVLLVVDMPQAHREVLMRAKESLDKVGGHILGVVFNRVRSNTSSYYYRHYYSADRGAKKTSKPNLEPGSQLIQQLIKGVTRR
jgi:non-specific protein-tyrosine kinase